MSLISVALVSFLASDPGRVSADSRQYLYLDPGAFLRRAISLWDPSIFAGTVPHQHLGFLWPMGPWFWLTDQLSLPMWIAQRFWLAGLAAAAGIGTLRLCRAIGVGSTAALVAAFAYQLTPYQLAFTARFSALLLPWAALPWLVLLMLRATREPGWRAPVAFGLVAATAGAVNASSLVLVLIAPALVVVDAAARRGTRAAIGGAARAAVVTLGASAWWIAGIVVQGRYGLPVLQLTENVNTVASASISDDIVRGLGNWIFTNTDGATTALEQAAAYSDNLAVRLATIALPALAVAVLILVRFRGRALLGALIVTATVIGTGVAPLDSPSAYGRLWRRFANSNSLGLALRNTPRVVPVLVLAVAIVLGIGIEQFDGTKRRIASAAVLVIVGLAISPAIRHGFLSSDFDRPEQVPTYWTALAADLDASASDARVLEIPGINFAAYDWGNTVEPILPGLIDRPTIAREILPAGGAGTVNLLGALDRQIQQSRFDPTTLAPIARLLGVSDVVVRGDLDSARFGLPDAAALVRHLAADPPPDFEVTGTYGEAGGGEPILLRLSLRSTHARLRADMGTPVLLSGDGVGIVEAAAAGLIDGDQPILESAVADSTAINDALARGAPVVLTDSNRKRATTFFYTIERDVGATERADRPDPDPTGYDVRYGPFSTAPPDAQTVAVELGGQVDASFGGGPEHPEDRAVHAFDGDPVTAWRPGPYPVGQWVQVHLDHPAAVPTIRLVTAPGSTQITSVAVIADGTRVERPLDGRARSTPGQPIDLPVSSVTDLRVEITGVDGTDIPGIAEVDLGGPIVDEALRIPNDLVSRMSPQDENPLVVLLTREQGDRSQLRAPNEVEIDRFVDLPRSASFAISGSVLTDPGARPEALCTDPVLTIDGRHVPVRTARRPDGSTALIGCERVQISAGNHRISTARIGAGRVVVDQVVLETVPIRAGGSIPSANLRLRADGARHLSATIPSHSGSFWLVLAESQNPGWQLRTQHGKVTATAMVDGYANGWLIQPDGTGAVDVSLSWTPQRIVWAGFAISALTVLLSLVVLARRRDGAPLVGPVDVGDRLPGPETSSSSGPVVTGIACVSFLLLVWFVSGLTVVAVAGVALIIRLVSTRSTIPLAAGAAAALVAAELGSRPSLVWAGLAIVVAMLMLDRLRPQGVTDTRRSVPG